jgi:hypothetical protein
MSGSKKDGRRESAITRRMKNLEKYTGSKEVDRAKVAYRDIACTCRNLKKEVPSEAKSCLHKLELKEENIVSTKVQAKAEEIPEEVLGASQE